MTAERADSAAGYRLRTLRQSRGETLEEVATQTGFSASTISRIESGKRRATEPVVVALCAHYGVDPARLIESAPLPHDGFFASPAQASPQLLSRYDIATYSDGPLASSEAEDPMLLFSAVLSMERSGPDGEPDLLVLTEQAISSAMRTLLATLDSQDAVARYRACRALAKLACMPMETLARVAVTDPDEFVRDAAAQLLATIGEAYCDGE